jgi:hypothetical protein
MPYNLLYIFINYIPINDVVLKNTFSPLSAVSKHHKIEGPFMIIFEIMFKHWQSYLLAQKFPPVPLGQS